MPRIVLARELQHEQIEFPSNMPFPVGRRGGRGSSLHLRRNSVRDVTSEELAHIREHRPEVFRCLDIVPEPRPSAALQRRVKSIERRREAAEKRAEEEAKAAAPVEAKKPSSGRSRKPKPSSE